MTAPKTCLECAHFSYHYIQSETDEQYALGGFSCGQGHYMDSAPFDEKAVRGLLNRAATCPDFEPLNSEPEIP